MKNDAYIRVASTTMLIFQMIEEALKICIGLSHQIIAITVPCPVQFRLNATSINNSALGRLITMYEVVTSRAELVKDLRKLTEWRNFFVHNAFMHELLARGGNSPFTQHSVEDLGKVLEDAKEVLVRLGQEVKELQALYKSISGKEFSESPDTPT